MNLSDEEIKRDLVLVGDLFDRGTESPDKIFDYFIQNNLTSVLGNHESLLLSSMGVRYDIPNFGRKEKARIIWSKPQNKGEIILNMTQQSNLFDAINSGNLGSSNRVQIEFGKAKVLGRDILLSINNTLKKQGKKPL